LAALADGRDLLRSPVLAETNRAPFDLWEGGQSEIVEGYLVDYSAMAFACSLGEYGNMILSAAGPTIMFLGGWLPAVQMRRLYGSHGTPILVFCEDAFVMLMPISVGARDLSALRYDKMMRIGWKVSCRL